MSLRSRSSAFQVEYLPGRLLYIDATIAVKDARLTIMAVFGPFTDQGNAEAALIAVAGRENCHGAIIRDPGGSRL